MQDLTHYIHTVINHAQIILLPYQLHTSSQTCSFNSVHLKALSSFQKGKTNLLLMLWTELKSIWEGTVLCCKSDKHVPFCTSTCRRRHTQTLRIQQSVANKNK